MWTSYTDFLRNWENLEGKRLCHEVIDRLVEFASFSKGEAQKKVLDRIKEVKKAYREFGLLAITTLNNNSSASFQVPLKILYDEKIFAYHTTRGGNAFATVQVVAAKKTETLDRDGLEIYKGLTTDGEIVPFVVDYTPGSPSAFAVVEILPPNILV